MRSPLKAIFLGSLTALAIAACIRFAPSLPVALFHLTLHLGLSGAILLMMASLAGHFYVPAFAGGYVCAIFSKLRPYRDSAVVGLTLIPGTILLDYSKTHRISLTGTSFGIFGLPFMLFIYLVLPFAATLGAGIYRREAPILKTFVYLTLGGLMICCVLCAVFWFKWMLPMQEHVKRVSKVEDIMAKYTPADWIALYNECIPLLGKPHPKEWPPRLKELAPPTVDIGNDGMFMSWTGGFDDEPLYLYLFTRPSKLDEDLPPEPAGIKIVGPSTLPERPYIKE